MRLTSHFANNTVTLLDFELAENMNREFSNTQREFNMFPRFTGAQWSSVSIGLGTFVLFASLWKYRTAETYLRNDVQRGQPLSHTLSETHGQQQLEGESAENHAGYRTVSPINQFRIWPRV